MSEEYNLAKSKKALGPLYPILKAKDGSIIDGFHRQNDDPDWESLTREQIDTPVKVELARLAANFCRRQMPASEFQNRVAFLIKSGLKTLEIAEQTGISESTILRHTPQELKNPEKVEAGRLGASARKCEQTVKTQDIPKRHTCEFCGVSNGEARDWNGHNLCRPHYAQALDDPAKYKRHFQPLKEGKEAAQVLKEPKPQTPMQMTKFADRELMMKVQHSQEELELIKELSLLGITPQQDYVIVLWGTKPDGAYPDKKIAVYYDGAVHDKGKALERDEEIRDAVEKLGWTVLVFRHGEGVPKEWALQVQETLRF